MVTCLGAFPWTTPSGPLCSERVRLALALVTPNASVPLHLIAVTGRLDSPTDGVRDYCEYLAEAFAGRGDRLEIVQLRWEVHGWLAALRDLWSRSRSWGNRIVLLQYTALMWSRRGFPFGALAVLGILKLRHVRLCVVFHDAGYEHTRGFVRRLRFASQNFMIRIAFCGAEFPILTVPASQLNWLPRNSARAVFIPVGANFPVANPKNIQRHLAPTPTVAVFGVTENPHTIYEVRQIGQAVQTAAAKIPGLRLLVFGRGALDAEAELKTALAGSNVELSISGVLPSEEVRERLAQADVLLFVRGAISSRRGSAIAGIVCGLPVVAYRGAETAPPITEAGVLLAENGDREGLGNALTRVLSDEKLHAELCQRSVAATEKYLSWNAIAAQFARTFSGREQTE